MATAVGDLVIRLNAQTTGAQRGLTQMQGLIGGLKSSAFGLIRAFAPIGGVALFAAALRSGEQFNKAMRESLAIMGHVSKQTETQMRATAIAVAKESAMAADETAKSYFYLVSAGLNAAQSMAALPQAAKFARAGMFDMRTATELAASSVAAMGLKGKTAEDYLVGFTRVTDVLTKANTLAQASTEEFAIALRTDAANAGRIAGQSLEQVVSVLAAFAEKGIKGEKAGTDYARALMYMSIQAVENQEAFKRAGVAMFDASNKTRTFVDVIGDLETRFAGMSDKERIAELKQLGFTKRTITLMNTLLGTSESIRKFERELDRANNTAEEIAKKQIGPLSKGFSDLKANVVEVSSAFMQFSGPALGDFLSGLGEVVLLLGDAGRVFGATIGEIVSFLDVLGSKQEETETKSVGFFKEVGRGLRILALELGKHGASLTILTDGYAEACEQVKALENQQMRLQSAWAAEDFPAAGISTKGIERLREHAEAGNKKAQDILRKMNITWGEPEFVENAEQFTAAIEQADKVLEKMAKNTAAMRGKLDLDLEDFLEPLRAAGANMETLNDYAEDFNKTLGELNVAKLEKMGSEFEKAIETLGMGSREAKIMQQDLRQVPEEVVEKWRNAARDTDRLVMLHGVAESIRRNFRDPMEEAREKILEITLASNLFADVATREIGRAAIGDALMQAIEKGTENIEEPFDRIKAQIEMLQDLAAKFPDLVPPDLMDKVVASLEGKGKDIAIKFARQIETPFKKGQREIAKIIEMAEQFPEIISPEMAKTAIDDILKGMEEAETKGGKKQVEVEYAGAFEKGSAEAWSSILKATDWRGGPQEKMSQGVIQTARNTLKTADTLEDVKLSLKRLEDQEGAGIPP